MNVERRIMFAKAVINSDYNVICLCETWLNDNIPSSELFLNDYCIYRQDRQMDQDKNTHGGALIAVKNSFISERVISEQPYSSLVCKIQLAGNEIFICAFYNPQDIARTVTRLTISKNFLKSFQNQKRPFYVGI